VDGTPDEEEIPANLLKLVRTQRFISHAGGVSVP
jgi:hypothetical protein